MTIENVSIKNTNTNVAVIIPAYNEAESIGMVLTELSELPLEMVRHVFVVDNASTDDTSKNAQEFRVTVLQEAERGYGAACLCAIQALRALYPANSRDEVIIVFLDGDGSDDPRHIPELIGPILNGQKDFMIGSRTIYQESKQLLTGPQELGNTIALAVIRLLYQVKFTDLGPLRALRLSTLDTLGLSDRSWGWNVEMQLRAARLQLRVGEIAVRYRKRYAGQSKISGSIIGSIRAATKILWVLTRELIRVSRVPHSP